MLVLPAESSPAHIASRLEHRNLDKAAANPSTALAGLVVRYGIERIAVDALHVAVPEGIERGAECPNRFCARNAFLDGGIDGSIVDEGTARRVDKVSKTVVVPGPQLCDLADCAGHRVLMAFGAGLRVVDWAQASRNRLTLLKRRFVGVEVGLSGESICLTIETREGLGN